MNTLTLPPPKSQLAEVLHGLIVKNEISERLYEQNGFRSRLTNIRQLGLNIRFAWKEKKNKFGHKVVFKVHYLWMSEKKKAIKIYKRLNKVA